MLATGSLRLDTIIGDQAASGVWNAFVQPLGFVVFVVAAFAEAARLPFDLPEAEQELIGGYHTEYAGMKLLLFLIAEFLHMITASFLIVILFLGGWHLWGLTGGADDAVTWPIARSCASSCFGSRSCCVILFFMLVRWSWPRFRFDQLMTLAWKVMLPLGLVNLVTVAVLVELRAASTASDAMHTWLLVAIGWGVMLAAWLVARHVWRRWPPTIARDGRSAHSTPNNSLRIDRDRIHTT